MNVYDTFKSGQAIVPIPVGIPVVLRYNMNGILDNMYSDFEKICEVSTDMFDAYYNNSIGPKKIPLTQGTTWVFGVLYTDFKYSVKSCKDLPEGLLSKMCEDFVRDPMQFRLYACAISSYASSFIGLASAYRFLNLAGFTTIQHVIVPNIPKKHVFEYVLSSKFQFKSRLNEIIGYFVYSNDGYDYVSTDIQQDVVKKIEQYLDCNGYVKIKLQLSDKIIYMDYSDYVRLKIHNNCNVILNCGEVRSVVTNDISSILDDGSNRSMICSICGKPISIPSSGPVSCTDTHCLSRRYPDLIYFLKSYDLPELSFDIYLDHIKSHGLSSFSDIFKLEPWKEYVIKTSLSDLLRSLIPIHVLPNRSIIDVFCQACNGNVNTFNYYINDTKNIQLELHLAGPDASRFLKWLSDSNNVSEIKSMLLSDNIEIINSDKKFNGPPIFRNKTIMVVGDCKHGTFEDMRAILRSYGAEVVGAFNSDVDCVIIGDTLDNINSKELQSAKFLGVPIFSEFQFFERYDIDRDMANLS